MAPLQAVLGMNHRNKYKNISQKSSSSESLQNHVAQMLEILRLTLPRSPLPSL